MAMGLAACQARCLSCGHCAHHCGKQNGKIMNTPSSYSSYIILPILNSNRITEERQKEAIKAMGLSSCQVHCIAVTGARHYSAKHQRCLQRRLSTIVTHICGRLERSFQESQKIIVMFGLLNLSHPFLQCQSWTCSFLVLLSSVTFDAPIVAILGNMQTTVHIAHAPCPIPTLTIFSTLLMNYR